MGILDEIHNAQHQPPTICLFGVFIGTLTEKDRADLLAALPDRNFSHRAIQSACKKYGYTGGETVVRRHRRGECVCR